MAQAGQWLLGIRIPLQWRYRPRFSRGSLHSTAMIGGTSPAVFKERFVVTPHAPECQEESQNYFGRAADGVSVFTQRRIIGRFRDLLRA